MKKNLPRSEQAYAWIWRKIHHQPWAKSGNRWKRQIRQDFLYVYIYIFFFIILHLLTMGEACNSGTTRSYHINRRREGGKKLKMKSSCIVNLLANFVCKVDPAQAEARPFVMLPYLWSRMAFWSLSGKGLIKEETKSVLLFLSIILRIGRPRDKVPTKIWTVLFEMSMAKWKAVAMAGLLSRPLRHSLGRIFY